MLAFKLMSALTLLLSSTSFATALPTATQYGVSAPFNLITVVTGQGDCSYGGLFIVGFHDGAGMNAAFAVAPPNDTSVGGYVLNNTYIDINFEPASNLPPYSLGFDGFSETLITNISDANIPVNLNAYPSQQVSGWAVEEGLLVYHGTDFPFQTFTVCSGPSVWNTYIPMYQAQLFWRNTSSTPDLEHCADVELVVDMEVYESCQGIRLCANDSNGAESVHEYLRADPY